jgi:hypothetical protein
MTETEFRVLVPDEEYGGHEVFSFETLEEAVEEAKDRNLSELEQWTAQEYDDKENKWELDRMWNIKQAENEVS